MGAYREDRCKDAGVDMVRLWRLHIQDGVERVLW